MNNPAKPGDTVELKDKETGFYDPETEFKVVRDQTAQLGESVGRRTNEAIVSGGLLVVGTGRAKTASKTADDDDGDDSDLPEDLPGREAFIEAKMNFEEVKSFNFDEGKVAGVGEATIKAVGKYLKK